jgi:hypothetical protein
MALRAQQPHVLVKTDSPGGEIELFGQVADGELGRHVDSDDKLTFT